MIVVRPIRPTTTPPMSRIANVIHDSLPGVIRLTVSDGSGRIGPIISRRKDADKCTRSPEADPDAMQRLLDVLLPPTCPGCGREGEIICGRCRKTLMRRVNEPAGVPLGLPTKVPAGIVQLEWCAAYNGPARACLHALKYDGERRLVQPLAEIMAER